MLLVVVQSVLVAVDEAWTVGDVLTAACSRRQLNADQHFIRLSSSVDAGACISVPDCRTPLLTHVTAFVVRLRLYYPVSPTPKKRPPFYFLNNSVKNKPILIIFGMFYPEKI